MNTATLIRKARESFKARRSKVFSYRRISTGKQRHGRGEKRQDSAALKWCQQNGHALESANCFSDRQSGFHGRNLKEGGGLRNILDLIEDEKIQSGDILLIESLDRLSRQAVNLAVQLLLQIINSGVVVVTLIDGATYKSDANPHELMASLMMSVAIFMRANDESRTKSMRKADSWQKKREAAAEGQYHGGHVPRWIKVNNGKYQVIADEAKRVKNIFADYVHNGLGLYRLEKKYGIPAPTIGYWMNNPVVTGTLTVTEGGAKIEIQNHYPAIVDRKIFALAQQKRADRFVKRAGRVGIYTNLFTSLLVDPNGVRMEASQHNGGIRNFVSPGFVIRCAYLEQMVCVFKMADRFVRVKEVAEATPTETKRLEKIEREMKQIQATLMEEPGLTGTLLPVLRKLQNEKSQIIGQPNVIHETIDVKSIVDLVNDENNVDARLRMRDIARQSITQIRLMKIESTNWHIMVSGKITTIDGKAIPFRFAYNTRRVGWIFCDGTQPVKDSSAFGHGKPVLATTLTDEVKAQCDGFPTRKQVAAGVTQKMQVVET